jgi:hypothetical protein
MSWIRAALTALVVVLVIGNVINWIRTAHYRGVAKAEAASNVRLQGERDAARASAELARQESDRVVAETERGRVRDSAEKARLEERGDSLEARLHDLGRTNAELRRAAEAELLEHDDWIRGETHRAVVRGLERTAFVTDSLRLTERAGRHVERAGRLREEETVRKLQVTVSELTADIGALEELDAGKDRQIAALERASSSSLFSLDLDAGLWAGVGLVIGYVAGSR